MSVRWRDSAAADMERIDAWLGSLEGVDPANVRGHIGSAIATLERLGDIGRPGDEPGTRKLSVRNAPYVIVYCMEGDDIDIVAVYHTAQKR